MKILLKYLLDELMEMNSWQGKLNLVYSYDNNKTTIKSAFHQAPFKLQRSFYPEGDQICHNLIIHTAGGVVGGDILRQNIHLLPETKVFMTTPSASKIYRSNQKKALQEIIINLENNTYLEYLPQETIVFNESLYHQKLRINLGKNATWLGWEIIRFGRSSRGEIFNQGQWLNYTEIYHNDKPLWLDRQFIEGESNLFSAINGLGNKPVVATLTLISTEKNTDFEEEIKGLIKKKFNNLMIGVTTIQQGLLCRYHGDSVSEAKTAFINIWQLLRGKYGLNPHYQSRFLNFP